MRIVIDPFDERSIAQAEAQVRAYKQWIQEKEDLLRQRLASIGVSVASVEFNQAVYDGPKNVSVRLENSGKTATIYAEGSAVAFIEFGSGERFGYGHPMNGELGTGPGTYPEGKGHWNDPNGWWYAHGKHSYGNPPAMAMVHARDRMVEQFTAIAREVFG